MRESVRVNRAKNPLVFSAHLGVGSALLMKAGDKIESTDAKGRVWVEGSWSLMVELAAWRVRKGTRIISGSQQVREDASEALKVLIGRAVEAVEIARGDCTIHLSGGFRVEIFTDSTDEDYEPWTLLRPGRKPYRPRPRAGRKPPART